MRVGAVGGQSLLVEGERVEAAPAPYPAAMSLERVLAAGPALMPFVTGGYPRLEETARLLPALARAGARAIEIGFPFSDPIADGPIIAQSMSEALRIGTTPARIFEMVRSVRASTPAALLAMVSCSIVQRMGGETFVEQAAGAGFDGLIVPDIDLSDARQLADRCRERGLAFTVLVAPTSPPERLRRIAELCSGFLYVLARVGITGERGAIPSDLAQRIAVLRGITDLPLAVGFGISDAAQVRAVLEVADAAIVGSALVRRMSEAHAQGRDAVAAATDFVAELAAAVPSAGART